MQTLSGQKGDLERQVLDLQQQVGDLTKQLHGAAASAATPKYVHAALAEHFYLELARGGKPVELLKEPLNVGLAAKGYRPPHDSLSVDQVNFDAVIEWVKAHPLSQLQSITPILSQPGYQRIDMKFAGDFYVTTVWHQFRLNAFLISDHELGTP